ncbi:hypothetical protein GGF32_002694 [Allomyces javanicus]|nr:hypothetical protein GGF32_002694 [Allomyces javanicus]
MKFSSLALAVVAAAFAVSATVEAKQVEDNSQDLDDVGEMSSPTKHVAYARPALNEGSDDYVPPPPKFAKNEPKLSRRDQMLVGLARARAKREGGVKNPGLRRTNRSMRSKNRKFAEKPRLVKRKLTPDEVQAKLKRAQAKCVPSARAAARPATLMSTAAAPGARKPAPRKAPAVLVPFVDPPFPAAIQHGADGSVRLVRKGMTEGNGVIHKYGFQTAKPLAIPAGTKYVTFTAQIKAQAKKPKPMHGPMSPEARMKGMPRPGSKAPLAPTAAPITVQAAHDHTNPFKCQDRSSLTIRGLKVKFHDSVPAGAKFSLSDSGYDYSSFDDAWDESYDDMWDDAYYGGDFSVEDAYDEDAADDEYDGGDFSVSEDAAYEGDEMWEDMYDGDFSVEDAYDEDAADDEYDGGDFSVSEDAAYEGDDMWEDSYDGGDFSVEDTYDEDAADDYY